MTFDFFDSSALQGKALEVSEQLSDFHSSFESKLFSGKKLFKNTQSEVSSNVLGWIDRAKAIDLESLEANFFKSAKEMYDGKEVNGSHTRGLNDLHQTWKKAVSENSPYADSIKYQQAGFAAEIISTAKENLQALADGTGNTVWRADDLPDEFPKNDQHVDKVIKNAAGETIDRIQVKFVGKNGSECLSKLVSEDYKKYLDDGKVDHIEIPKDFYQEIRDNHLIKERVDKLERQLERAVADGKKDVASSLETRIERYHKVDKMLKESVVTKAEAVRAVKNPQRYITKLFATDLHKAGVSEGLSAATLTAAVSTVDNVSQWMQGEITPEQAATNIVKETGTAGAMGYATGFVSRAVATGMEQSSHQMLQSLSKTGVPAAVITFGVESFDSISDFAQGDIDATELAYDLGENAANVAGGAAGTAAVGALLTGVTLPATGTFALGLVGGMVGCAVAAQAYQTAVSIGSAEAPILAEKVQNIALDTVTLAQQGGTEQAFAVQDAINTFAMQNELPFSIHVV